MTEIDESDPAIIRDLITHEFFYFIEFNDRRSDDGIAGLSAFIRLQEVNEYGASIL